MEKILKKSTIQKHRRNQDRNRTWHGVNNDRRSMSCAWNKQTGILSVGKKRNKNKVQGRDSTSVGNGEKETTAEDRRTEIILDIEREL